MSKYIKIQTQFTNGQSLLRALKDLGLAPVYSSNLQENSAVLSSRWGRSWNVAIAVDHQQFEVAFGCRMWDGMGFIWNGSSYDMVCDHIDNSSGTISNRIRQRYALVEAKRLAMLQGYEVYEQPLPDGSVQLVCTQY